MSPFEVALHNYANAPHGLEKLMCLRSALSAHQESSAAASGRVDEGLNGQIRAIDRLLQARGHGGR